jgi:hypothetical protein
VGTLIVGVLIGCESASCGILDCGCLGCGYPDFMWEKLKLVCCLVLSNKFEFNLF